MIFVTSISPTHVNKDSQQKAVDSWIKYGSVYSLNSVNECDLLRDKYPNVQFVSTCRTMEKTYGKPYIQLSAIIDFCKTLKDEYICIINSDIEIKTEQETIDKIAKLMPNNIVLSNRINHNGDYIGDKYIRGIDVFFIHQRFLNVFPQTMHALGMTFVDYFIPYVASNAGINCIFIEQNFAYHLNHDAQYSNDNWVKSGRYFIWENNLQQFDYVRGIGRMSEYIFNFIYNFSEKKKI